MARGPLPLEPEAGELYEVRDQLCHMMSIAISLKRIADAMTQRDKYGQTGSAAMSPAIYDAIRDGRA